MFAQTIILGVLCLDCSQAAANLLADEQECEKRNQEIAPPLTSEAPIQDLSQMVCGSNPNVTVGSTFLGSDHHGEKAHLSIDEYFRMRTDYSERPNFGRDIISPEKRFFKPSVSASTKFTSDSLGT